MWAVISRTPALNMILVELKVAINTDALYSTSRQSKLCETWTQQKNPVNSLHVTEPFRHHFNTRPMWQLIPARLTGLPACTYLPYTAPCTYHTVKLWCDVDNSCQVWPTAVYPPSWDRVNSVCKVANATLQFNYDTFTCRYISLLSMQSITCICVSFAN